MMTLKSIVRSDIDSNCFLKTEMFCLGFCTICFLFYLFYLSEIISYKKTNKFSNFWVLANIFFFKSAAALFRSPYRCFEKYLLIFSAHFWMTDLFEAQCYILDQDFVVQFFCPIRDNSLRQHIGLLFILGRSTKFSFYRILEITVSTTIKWKFACNSSCVTSHWYCS
jgi:hypothetical protein